MMVLTISKGSQGFVPSCFHSNFGGGGTESGEGVEVESGGGDVVVAGEKECSEMCSWEC